MCRSVYQTVPGSSPGARENESTPTFVGERASEGGSEGGSLVGSSGGGCRSFHVLHIGP